MQLRSTITLALIFTVGFLQQAESAHYQPTLFNDLARVA